jgi:hypothetical protein
MRPEEKVACARAMQDNPLFSALMDEMEKTAVDQCVNAKPIDHDTRAAMAAEVRAIRRFRQKIRGLIDEASAPSPVAPA